MTDTTASCSTKLRRLHDEWWRAVIAKKWTDAQNYAAEMEEVVQELSLRTEVERVAARFRERKASASR